ncbi:FxSxx-COOH system tetratricopeptide repeat protein [Streptomyces sp. NPDC052107]|uniref:FxSxx-COOH system tetratricopeptide repeat protein n=1 Tax=Streptomyces sp. NPDC052107 TaxID=3155632 RepID=UPI00343F6BCC
MIPPRADCFQDRAEAARLRQALAGVDTAVLVGQDTVRGQVLTGMGGVGKTQLAADYARTAWQTRTLDVLVWITADTRSAAVTGYAKAAAEVLAADTDDLETAAEKFVAWLEPKPHQRPCRWLIVLDDVADPEALHGLWPPASPHGRTLVTTRRRDAALTGRQRRLINVGLFTRTEALAYLTTALAAHDRHEPDEQLAALAADLGHLPLALSQAAAYLIDSGQTAAAYRTLLADRTATLADAAPAVLPDDQTRTMSAAWSLSIERADTLPPAGLARPMLQLAAFLDPNGIPETVLTSPPALAHLTAERAGYRRPEATGEDATGALRALHRLSLIDHTPNQTVRVHELIQRAVRERLPDDHKHPAARTAADALLAAWPDVERDTTLAQALRANTTALTSCAADALYQPGVHTVLYRMGTSLGESGQVTAAVDHFHHLAATTRRQLGPDHLDTLTARHDLAYWRGEAGDAAGAATALAELLEDRVRVLGPHHPDTSTTRGNLAYWRGWAGDAAGAATAFAELLEDRVRVVGPDHPDTLNTRHNLAYWRGVAGDAAGAATAFAELLEDRVRVVGPDHPHTLNTRHNLARWRGEAGDAAGAATALAELLEDHVRVLGPDHPDTLTVRHKLAHWRGEAGDAAGPATAFAELLEDRVRVLGPDHPDTLNTRHNLARWRGEAGDAAGAATAFAELLEDRVRVVGPDHPDTLSTRHQLARWRGEAGDAAGAVEATTKLLEDRVRVHGPDHPHTLNTRHNLARWRGEAGDAAGAATAFAELLEDRVRVLGPDHPHTLNTRHNLARWRGEAGDAAGAATALAELLEDQVRVLGPDHPHTLNTGHQLARWRGEAGESDGAVG